MEELPSLGVKNILVIAPAFSVDCLETIEEIDEENKEIFLKAGGNEFEYVPCLNDTTGHIECLNKIIERHLETLK